MTETELRQSNIRLRLALYALADRATDAANYLSDQAIPDQYDPFPGSDLDALFQAIGYARRELDMTHTPGPWHNNGGRIVTNFTSDATRSAAPDLLDALEQTRSALTGAPCTCNDDRDCDRCYSRRKAKQAIAKAKGENKP